MKNRTAGKVKENVGKATIKVLLYLYLLVRRYRMFFILTFLIGYYLRTIILIGIYNYIIVLLYMMFTLNLQYI